MHQLPRRTFGGDKIKPSPRAHAGRQLQNALRDGIAPAKIIKQPAIQLGGLQIFLYRLHVKTHGVAHSLLQPTISLSTLDALQAPESVAPSLRALPRACCGCDDR